MTVPFFADSKIKFFEIDKKEALSYLKYKNNKPDSQIETLLLKYEKLLIETTEPRYVYGIFTPTQLNSILIGNDIKKHLLKPDCVALMAVSLGFETDKLLRRIGITDIGGAVLLDALANAGVEQICEYCENEIKKVVPGAETTARFSPGYGDFPIEIQGDFLNKLDAGRKINLYVNESHILTPRKSVTAVVGIKQST